MRITPGLTLTEALTVIEIVAISTPATVAL